MGPSRDKCQHHGVLCLALDEMMRLIRGSPAADKSFFLFAANSRLVPGFPYFCFLRLLLWSYRNTLYKKKECCHREPMVHQNP